MCLYTCGRSDPNKVEQSARTAPLVTIYMAHCIPCFAKTDEMGVSGSIAKYGTSPTITTETIMYKQQQIDNAAPIPSGRSLCGFFTSSAVLATVSKPIYAKKTVADPASIPFIPCGKYLKCSNGKCISNYSQNTINCFFFFLHYPSVTL
jgi:hypothetical protein